MRTIFHSSGPDNHGPRQLLTIQFSVVCPQARGRGQRETINSCGLCDIFPLDANSLSGGGGLFVSENRSRRADPRAVSFVADESGN